MRLPNRTYKAISLTTLSVSIVAWILLLYNPSHVLGVVHCHVSDAGPSRASVEMLLLMNPISSLLCGWCLMVVAMMLPKLLMPVCFIYSKALKRRRQIMALLFILGYLFAWALMGIPIVAIMLGSSLTLPGSFVPAVVVATIALVWQFSPVKQYCMNKGHEHPYLPAFGWPSFRDTFLFGLKHGIWCIGSGWALMIFPMLLPDGHHLAMIFVTFVMVTEHLEHPQTPRWRFQLHGRLMRMLSAQTQIRIKQLRTILATDLNPLSNKRIFKDGIS